MRKTCEHWKQHFPAGKFGAHLFPEFEMRTKAVSSELFRVPRMSDAAAILIELVEAIQARKAVVVESPIQEAAGITAELRSRGVTVYTEAADIAAHADTADIGISGVEFGIAETGSVFQDGYDIATRLVTILPPLHVVFLQSAYIVPSIEEAFEIISPGFDRGYVGFITGPSRFVIIAVDEEPKGGAA